MCQTGPKVSVPVICDLDQGFPFTLNQNFKSKVTKPGINVNFNVGDPINVSFNAGTLEVFETGGDDLLGSSEVDSA